MSFYYPIGIDLRDRRVLMSGGGELALRECRRLLEAGAFLDVVARSPLAELRELASTHCHRLTILKQSLADLIAGALKDYFLVFAYSRDGAERRQLVEACRAGGILVTEPEHGGDFEVPCSMRRGHLKIAVSTDGLSDALARALLERIEADTMDDMDGYFLYLEFVRGRLTSLPRPMRAEDQSRLSSCLKELSQSREIESAILRRNFPEAERLFEDRLQLVLAGGSN
ncbi:MAG: bifunctional precorrin-2 dehydrogenase/sirohydrochlorin ferrochelatase [Candidatus Obscuribacterales bacterium]